LKFTISDSRVNQTRHAIVNFRRRNLVIRQYRTRGPQGEAAGEDLAERVASLLEAASMAD
jgi:hypothetical protein